MPTRDHRRTVAVLLEQQGRTVADEAGITLADIPAPLYQLLVLATPLSARVSAKGGGRRGPRALSARTPHAPHDAGRELAGSGGCPGPRPHRRYDEGTATVLGDGAQLCQDRYSGDLRRLHQQTSGDADELRRLLTDFPGIGPTGADIFLREVQAVWSDITPFVEGKVVDGAKRLRLPSSLTDLAEFGAHSPAAASAVRAGADGARPQGRRCPARCPELIGSDV
jgi:hypothetical protein